MFPTARLWILPRLGLSEVADPQSYMESASVPGVDLIGGYGFELVVSTSGLNDRGSEDAVRDTYRILRDRLDRIGIIEFDMERIGDAGIAVRLPVSADTALVKQLLTHNGRLEFRLFKDGAEVQRLRERIDNALTAAVANDSSGSALAGRPFSDRLASLTIDEGIADIVVEQAQYETVRSILADTSVQASVKAFNRANPPAAEFVWASETVVRAGKTYHPLYVVNRDADLVASPLETARVGEPSAVTQDLAAFAVRVLLSDAGREDLTNISSANVGKRLATSLNDEILMTLPIQGRISDGRTEIPGGETIAEARILAAALASGDLPTSVALVRSEYVSATAAGGPDVASAALASGVAALVLIIIILTLFYRGAGIVASAALLFQLLMTGMFLRLCIIAGITPLVSMASLVSIALSLILGTGMHIYVFHRIREGLSEDANVRSACQSAFETSTTVVFSTFGVVLLLSVLFMILGTGPLLDGALSLLSGAAAGLITLHFFTRTVITVVVEEWNLTKMSV